MLSEHPSYKKDYDAFVEKSKIIERVLFTDKDNTFLLNKVFQKVSFEFNK